MKSRTVLRNEVKDLFSSVMGDTSRLIRRLAGFYAQNPDIDERTKNGKYKNISDFINRINPKKWTNYTDEEIINELIEIKGIGRWTAEMFLIFNLCRPDIFPADDLGVIKGICICYNIVYPITKERAIKMSEKWKPYRSVATWYFWRSLDPIPVEY